MHTLEMKKKGFIKNKVMEAIITQSVEKATLIPFTHVWSLKRTEPTPSQCYLRGEIPIHQNILLHM
jgi:hypothetical protein